MCLVGRRRSLGYSNTLRVGYNNQENCESVSIVGHSSQHSSPDSAGSGAPSIELSPTHDIDGINFPSNEGDASLMDIFFNPTAKTAPNEQNILETETPVDCEVDLIDFSSDVEIQNTNGTEDNISPGSTFNAQLFWFERLDDEFDFIDPPVLELNRSSTKKYHGPVFNNQFGPVHRYMNAVRDEEQFLEQATVSTTIRSVPRLIPINHRSYILPNPQILHPMTIEVAFHDVEFGRLHFMDSN